VKIATIMDCEIHLERGDITDQRTDAIVNAANSSLMGGGGVDGAIHRHGGKIILKECKEIRGNKWPDGLPTGEAVITSGGNLHARYVIHTVGPVWRGGKRGEPELLANAYRNSLQLSVDQGLKSISFPSISTGAYGYPIYEAGRIALSTIKSFLEEHEGLEKVIMILFSDRDYVAYKEASEGIFKT
jgi:O-acetyl-ADP-ribose deacetylase (regulator of RNase III)